MVHVQPGGAATELGGITSADHVALVQGVWQGSLLILDRAVAPTLLAVFDTGVLIP